MARERQTRRTVATGTPISCQSPFPASTCPSPASGSFFSLPETRQASTMSEPPTAVAGPSSSPIMAHAKKAPHSGSVEKTTMASADEISPSDTVSANEQPAVVTRPVQSKAASRATCSSGAEATVPTSRCSCSMPPDPAAADSAACQTAAMASTAARFQQVMATGRAMSCSTVRWRRTAFSHSQKPPPKNSGCSRPSTSPGETEELARLPHSRQATPSVATSAAAQTRGGWSLPPMSWSRSGHTITERESRKACRLADEVCSAIACTMYPPPNMRPTESPSRATGHETRSARVREKCASVGSATKEATAKRSSAAWAGVPTHSSISFTQA
mmetsp:Transcript_7915/g.25968  ORF Transcript_7915/g.25968 Transcript_7915/m.25968 type:complete len:330 (+) Transcript_7915:439-1428(+)|eukprot:scaffold20325_cov130-Isochrysis_galbana.AAC.3